MLRAVAQRVAPLLAAALLSTLTAAPPTHGLEVYESPSTGSEVPGAGPTPPCQLQRGDPTAIVLGGDDAGTGAAWALASLGVKTLLVLTHRRDLGGDPASFYHDGGGMVRNGGGLNDQLLCSTNDTCASGPINSNVA